MPRNHGANQYTMSSCTRCRSKKLKCDDQAGSCRNCIKSGTECMIVDSYSRKLYRRSYVSQLQSRIKEMESTLSPSRPRAIENCVDITPIPSMWMANAKENSHGNGAGNDGTPGSINGPYHGTGSVISIARLVAAAVSAKATSRTFSVVLRDTSALQTFQDDYHRAQPVEKQDISTSQRLLASYLGGFHLLHPFLQRSRLEELFSHMSNDEFSCQASSSDIFRYFMVCAIGALRLVRSGSHSIPAINYYATAMMHEQQALKIKGIEQIQNVLLILVFGVLYETVSNKWDLARLAVRTCIENNLHRYSSTFTPMEEQMRRRVFWTTYILERQASVTVGRPFAISDEDISIEPPIDVDDDIISLPNCVALQEARGSSEVSMQIRHIKIRQFSSRIQYILSMRYDNVAETRNLELHTILRELDIWRASVPQMPDGENIYQSNSWIDLNYQKERLSCLKALAFMSTTGNPSYVTEHISPCLEAAIGVVENYVGLASSDERVMNWMCVQDILSSGFTILYCLHLLSNRQNSGVACDPSSRLITHEMITRSFKAISTCSGFLSHISARWKTVTKQERLFSALANEIQRQADHSLAAAPENNAEFDRIGVAANTSPEQGIATPQISEMEASLNDENIFSLGAESLMNVDFDDLDWTQILALGQDNLTLADVGL